MAVTDTLPLTLIIITPDNKIPDIRCDSINLPVCDNKKGKKGGSYGIRKGHINCLIALGEGEITAKTENSVIFSKSCKSGIAEVNRDSVTLTLT